MKLRWLKKDEPGPLTLQATQTTPGILCDWQDVPVVDEKPDPCCDDWEDHFENNVFVPVNDGCTVIEGSTERLRFCPWCGVKK